MKLVCKNSTMVSYDVNVYFIEGEAYTFHKESALYYSTKVGGIERWIIKAEVDNIFYNEAESLVLIRKEKIKNFLE
jgi:hypothetical protein